MHHSKLILLWMLSSLTCLFALPSLIGIYSSIKDVNKRSLYIIYFCIYFDNKIRVHTSGIYKEMLLFQSLLQSEKCSADSKLGKEDQTRDMICPCHSADQRLSQGHSLSDAKNDALLAQQGNVLLFKTMLLTSPSPTVSTLSSKDGAAKCLFCIIHVSSHSQAFLSPTITLAFFQ